MTLFFYLYLPKYFFCLTYAVTSDQNFQTPWQPVMDKKMTATRSDLINGPYHFTRTFSFFSSLYHHPHFLSLSLCSTRASGSKVSFYLIISLYQLPRLVMATDLLKSALWNIFRRFDLTFEVFWAFLLICEVFCLLLY